jgi:hypothetical protein
MGGKSSSETTQNSTTQPWQPAQPLLGGILSQLSGNLPNTGITGAQTNAINTIENNAQNAGQFTPQLTSLVNTLMSGGGITGQAGDLQSNLDTLRSQLTPFANGSMVGNNQGLQSQLDTIRNDVTNQVNGQFAAAGRDGSGMNQQTLARGIAQGMAPVIAGQYNQDIQNQINAANSLFGAGNTTSGLLTGLTQQGLQNQQAGASLVPSVLDSQNAGANSILQAEAQRYGIPLQNLGLLANIGIPIAGLGSQSNGTSNTQNQMSGADQFGKIASGMNSLVNPMSWLFG